MLVEVNAKDEDGNAITDHNRSYLMADDCAEKYYELFDKKIKEAGFVVDPGYCPLLLAEQKERLATQDMNKMAADELAKPGGVKIDVSKIYDTSILKKLADLNLQYILQFS